MAEPLEIRVPRMKPSKEMRELFREHKASNDEMIRVTKETGAEMKVQNDALVKILAGLERRVRKLEKKLESLP